MTWQQVLLAVISVSSSTQPCWLQYDGWYHQGHALHAPFSLRLEQRRKEQRVAAVIRLDMIANYGLSHLEAEMQQNCAWSI
jgi:hypothetical protein